jgi:hypothetical protein
MIKENLYEVSRILSKLDTAYNNSDSKDFKKMWLSKWNDFAKENSGKNFKPRDYDFEQELNVDKSNIMCNS